MKVFFVLIINYVTKFSYYCYFYLLPYLCPIFVFISPEYLIKDNRNSEGYLLYVAFINTMISTLNNIDIVTLIIQLFKYNRLSSFN